MDSIHSTFIKHLTTPSSTFPTSSILSSILLIAWYVLLNNYAFISDKHQWGICSIFNECTLSLPLLFCSARFFSALLPTLAVNLPAGPHGNLLQHLRLRHSSHSLELVWSGLVPSFVLRFILLIENAHPGSSETMAALFSVATIIGLSPLNTASIRWKHWRSTAA